MRDELREVMQPSMQETLVKIHKRSFAEMASLAFYRSDLSGIEAELANISEPTARAALKVRLVELQQTDSKIRLDALQKLNKYYMRHLTVDEKTIPMKAPLTPQEKAEEIATLLAHHPSLLRDALEAEGEHGSN